MNEDHILNSDITLEIIGVQPFFWRGGHESGPLARGSRDMLSREILKNRVSLMPFPTFWSRFLCLEQVTNEKKKH